MTKIDMQKKIMEDEDYINSAKYDNSLTVFEKKHPEGAKDEVIAKSLMITEEELKLQFEGLLDTVRKKMNIEDIND
jgi:hypothetical protein